MWAECQALIHAKKPRALKHENAWQHWITRYQTARRQKNDALSKQFV